MWNFLWTVLCVFVWSKSLGLKWSTEPNTCSGNWKTLVLGTITGIEFPTVLNIHATTKSQISQFPKLHAKTHSWSFTSICFCFHSAVSRNNQLNEYCTNFILVAVKTSAMKMDLNFWLNVPTTYWYLCTFWDI